MVDFKGLILVACLVTVLGLNTNRHIVFPDGFFCTLICQNRPDIKGRAAKCLITNDESIHSTLVRNPGYGDWEFYAVDDIDIEEDKLCEEVAAGDAFLKNHTDTICPSSLQYAKYYDTTIDKNVRSSTAESSNNTEEMKTLIGELDTAVNKVFRNTGVTTRRFSRIDKRANAVARKVVETMNHLKQEVGLLDFGGIDATSTESSHGTENGEEPLDGVEDSSKLVKDVNKRSDDDFIAKSEDSEEDCKNTRSNDATELVRTLVNMVNDLAEAVENEKASQSKRTSHSSNNEKDSDNLKEDDSPTPPPVAKYRSNDSPRPKKKGLSHIAPPTSPPYNPTDYSNQGDEHTTNKKRGFFYILPPTSPPYNPTDFKHRDILEDYDEEDELLTPPSVPKQIAYDTPKCNNEGLSYILPPTSPPYNPNDFRHEHAPKNNDEGNSPNYSHSTKKRNEIYTSTNPPPTNPPHSVVPSRRKSNDDDLIRGMTEALEELNNEYKRSDSESLKEIVENLHEEVTQIEKSKKRSGSQPESAYPLLLSPIVDAVAESIDSVKRSSQANDEEDESLRAQYRPVDFNSMDALCALMTLQTCERTKLLHCKNDDTCCWAYINASTCNEDFKDCYSALTTILDTLMT